MRGDGIEQAARHNHARCKQRRQVCGRELARMLNFIHLDVEDYWFIKLTYRTAIRPQEERNGMLLLI